MSIAEELLDQVGADPAGALIRGRIYVEGLGEDEQRERAIALRAMSLGARFTNQIETSIVLADEAVESAREGGHDQLEALAVLTLSGSMAIAGRISEALEIVVGARRTTDDVELDARFRFQEAAILANTGRIEESVDAFREVLPMFRSLGDSRSLILVLNRLGSNLTMIGELPEAERYLTEALEAATESGENTSIPGIEHNLGLLAAHQGDLPRALDLLLRSDEKSMAITGAPAPQHVARCEVLLSAGLFEEALALAKQVAAYNEENHDIEHAANAFLVAARAAALAGRNGEAVELAGTAMDLLIASESPSLALEARSVILEARYAESGATKTLQMEAGRIAEHLESDGLLVAAGHARLLAGRMAAELGDTGLAHELLGRVASITRGPVELRLQARLAAALLRIEDGDTRGAAAAIRSGLDLMDRYQEVLGATDLRMGIERHAAELGAIGLRLAIESSRPRRVMEWMERTRARALRFTPVSPSDDDRVRELLSNLRRIDAELRTPDNRDPRVLRQRRRLQDEIAHTEWTRRTTLSAVARPTIGQLIDSLGDGTLVELGVDGDELLGVVVANGRAHLNRIGSVRDVLGELRQVRFAMRRAARMGRPFDSAVLDRLQLVTLGTIAPAAENVVVVPPPGLMAIPWAALPGLRGGSVTVSPSSDLWWRSHQQEMDDGRAVVAGGPDLAQAGDEVSAIAGLYEGATALPPGSTVEKVKAGLDGATIAHIACHATFQIENPMFSSLRLGDGDLNVYDIERLERPPQVVVLSACDSGFSEARSGDELAGLTSALLSMGTRTVVASVGLVPDSPATSELMVDFHRGMIAGSEPSVALARAQHGAFDDPERFLSAASFICVGA